MMQAESPETEDAAEVMHCRTIAFACILLPLGLLIPVLLLVRDYNTAAAPLLFNAWFLVIAANRKTSAGCILTSAFAQIILLLLFLPGQSKELVPYVWVEFWMLFFLFQLNPSTLWAFHLAVCLLWTLLLSFWLLLLCCLRTSYSVMPYGWLPAVPLGLLIAVCALRGLLSRRHGDS